MVDWPAGQRAALWVVRVPPVPAAWAVGLLSPGEREKLERFTGAERQSRYAHAHALARTVLAGLSDLSPSDLEIQPGRNGRPGLAGDSRRRAPDLDFNLSTTPGLAALAVSRGAAVGVDLERPRDGVDEALLSDRWLSESDRRWLAAAGEPNGFYRLWTTGEALGKALGEGLGLPFGRLDFAPRGDATLAPRLDALGDAAQGWRCWQWMAGGVPGALALRADGSAAEDRGQVQFEPPYPGEDFEPVRVSVLATPRDGETP